jgi:hypothetical protein
MLTLARLPGERRLEMLPRRLAIADVVNDHLAASIDAALQGVDPGHGNAMIDLNNAGLEGIIVHRFNDTWSVVGAATYHFHGPPEGEVAVRGSW